MRRTQEEITRRELVANLANLADRVSLLEGSREPGGRHHHN
jgi:hypothetical protein